MTDKRGTRSQLLHEVETLRQRVAALEQAANALPGPTSEHTLTLDHMLEGCQIISFDWRYFYLNAAAIRHSQKTREELLGRTMNECYPGIENTPLFAVLRRCMETRTPQHIENLFTYPDGSQGWFELSVQPVPEGIFILSFDITERQRDADALRASEAQYRLLADHMADVIWILDPATQRFTYVSPSVERLRGYTPEEALDQTLDQVMPPDSYEAINRMHSVRLRAFLAGDGDTSNWQTEIEQIRKDGSTVWTEVVTTLFRNEAGAPRILGVSRDISERKQAEAEIRQLNAELEQRVRQRTAELEAANQELEAFAYSVSHDLRAPLRAMDGFSRILIEEFAPDLPSPAQRYLGLVRENAQQMGRLIDHLLAFSRLGRQPLNVQRLDPADEVRRALEELNPAREGRSVTLVIGDLPPCRADPVLLRQVYVNLLGNALKFTRGRDNPTIEVGDQDQNGQVVYFVKDNGIGFDMQYAHKLFGVFQRLHRAEDFEGTGVGLAIVQRIIHRHGGSIWAEAEVNRGAVFYFTLGERSHD